MNRPLPRRLMNRRGADPPPGSVANACQSRSPKRWRRGTRFDNHIERLRAGRLTPLR
jgi:hypothetical protein